MPTVPACNGCGEEIDLSKSHTVIDEQAYHNGCVGQTAPATEKTPEATPGNGDEGKAAETASPTAESEEKG